MTIGAVSAVPVLTPNILYVVEKRNRQRERQKEKKKGRPDDSWHCSRSTCPHNQLVEKEKRKERKGRRK